MTGINNNLLIVHNELRNLILSIALLLFLIFPAGVSSQYVINLYNNIKEAFQDQDYCKTLDLCNKFLQCCEGKNEAECRYTNVMKDIYRYKGLSEFEIYKQELSYRQLSAAIESLSNSYLLFNDPEVHFLQGYLEILLSIINQPPKDLSGIIIAWESILDLYTRDRWQVTPDLILKLRMFIAAVEKFSQPDSVRHYSGSFARFIIGMACDLVESGTLLDSDYEYFNEIRLKYGTFFKNEIWQSNYRNKH